MKRNTLVCFIAGESLICEDEEIGVNTKMDVKDLGRCADVLANSEIDTTSNVLRVQTTNFAEIDTEALKFFISDYRIDSTGINRSKKM
ncbi:hypothetical protein QE152_g15526 [Popillia japonica]|uniref:Uncharacterized protein n=1 Tax=Popillia japonica TaxID=7064 RepID=A0AAW1L6U1_POPJA